MDCVQQAVGEKTEWITFRREEDEVIDSWTEKEAGEGDRVEICRLARECELRNLSPVQPAPNKIHRCAI